MSVTPLPGRGHPPDPDELDGGELAVARARRDLPPRDPALWDGFLGGASQALAPYSEADPLGVLVTLLSFCGVALGPEPHVWAGDDRQPLLIWPMVIGRTSAGRKGASYSTARRVMRAALPAFTGPGGNVRTGLTSGEGLAQLFATTAEDTPPEKAPSGALPPGDTRLLVFEPEWAAVMARMRREGSSLSAMLRAAWEGGDLSTMNVNARHAPESHIGVLAHITPKEFAAKVSAADMAGGTYNRFLPFYVARSKFLPLSTGTPPELVDELGAALRHRLDAANGIGPIGFTVDGAHTWRRLYVEFGGDSGDDGPIEQFISRAAPNCLRIAAIHAALDGETRMTTIHLRAAAALVRYAVASARAVFGADPSIQALADYIAAAGPAGRTRVEINSEHYQRRKSAAEIDTALNELTNTNRIVITTRARSDGRAGRAATVYVAQARTG